MSKKMILIFIIINAVSIYSQNHETDAKIDSEKTIVNKYMSGDHELFIMPTASTMPEGSVYLTDYELILLNLTFAPTNSTHIGLFTIFPMYTEFYKTLTFGAKQRYYTSENFSSAVFASYTFQNSLYSFGNVISFGNYKINGHVAFTFVGAEKSVQSFKPVIMVGTKLKVSKAASIIAEYTSFATFNDEDFNGLLTIGVRIGGEHFSGELAGIRPLTSEQLIDFLFFPFLKVTYIF